MATDMAGVSVEAVTGPYHLGEGPHWDHEAKKLYFVDILKQKILRLDPATGSVTSIYLEDGPVGFAVPVADQPGKLLAGCGKDLVLVDWNGEKDLAKASVQKLASVDADRGSTRWNDGKVDSAGRLWGGTMAVEVAGHIESGQGSLYSFVGKQPPKREESPVSISNGLAWSLKDDTFYYIDSPKLQVYSYDYDPKTGNISNKKVVFDLKENNVSGLPDGMTIDTDGNLWIALFCGSRVIQVNPKSGKLLRTVNIPARNITSVAFGGPDLDILYVTSAVHGVKESDKEPNHGCVFAVKGLGVRGLKANSFKLNA